MSSSVYEHSLIFRPQPELGLENPNVADPVFVVSCGSFNAERLVQVSGQHTTLHPFAIFQTACQKLLKHVEFVLLLPYVCAFSHDCFQRHLRNHCPILLQYR